jgi:hypothetical protein
MASLEQPDDLGQVRAAVGGQDDAQPQLAHQPIGAAAQVVDRRLELLARRPHAGAQALADRRQRHTPARALEERRAHHGLQGAHELADARGRDAQSIGRATEVKLLGDDQERPQVPQLHVLDHTWNVSHLIV